MVDTEAVEKIVPYTCDSCGHTWMVSLEPDFNKCPRCGTCVECV